MTPSANIKEIASLVEDANRILSITGAGISADSGLPTYRGVGGLYSQGLTEEGLPIETALSHRMFLERPAISWKYIAQIEQTCRGKKPNTGHYFFAELEKSGKRVCILTQNVDGFHHQAGSTNVIDIHGHIYDIVCSHCRFRCRVESYSELDIPPSCPRCRKILRPDVVLFDEMLPVAKLARLEKELEKGFDLVFSIGTTSFFPYIAQPVIAAAKNGIPTVEINPDRTAISPIVRIKIDGKAAETLRKVEDQWKEKH